MCKRQAAGFSLLELMLVVGIAGFLLLAWSSSLAALWSDAARSQYRAQQAQYFYQFGLWLAYDLERARERGVFRWHTEDACVIYGADGVRLVAGMMQWRPKDIGCDGPGWISMYDPNGFQIDHFAIIDESPEPPVLRLTGSYEGVSWQWRYRFRGKVIFE